MHDFNGNTPDHEYIDEVTEQLLAEYEERERMREQFKDDLAKIVELSRIFGYELVDEFLRLNEN